jgi:hypothetical protein
MEPATSLKEPESSLAWPMATELAEAYEHIRQLEHLLDEAIRRQGSRVRRDTLIRARSGLHRAVRALMPLAEIEDGE